MLERQDHHGRRALAAHHRADRVVAGVGREGRRLLEGLAERLPASEDTPRGRYEQGRKGELRAAQERFAAEVVQRRPRLVEALERIERLEIVEEARRRHFGVDPQPRREIFFECRGYKKRKM